MYKGLFSEEEKPEENRYGDPMDIFDPTEDEASDATSLFGCFTWRSDQMELESGELLRVVRQKEI